MNSALIRVLITPLVALLFYLAPLRLGREQLLKLAFFLWALGGFSLTVGGAFRLSETLGEVGPVMLALGVVGAVIIGVGKGKFVLSKTSKRNIERINAFTEPQKAVHVYSLRSWIIIGIMLLISAALNWFEVPPFWRGIVNLAVGLALLMSSLAYLNVKAPSSNEA